MKLFTVLFGRFSPVLHLNSRKFRLIESLIRSDFCISGKEVNLRSEKLVICIGPSMLCTSNRTSHSCLRGFLNRKEPAIASSPTTKRSTEDDDRRNRAEKLTDDELGRRTQQSSVTMAEDSAAITSLQILRRTEEREREMGPNGRRSRKDGRLSLEVDPKSKGRENPQGRRSLPTALDGSIKHDPKILSVPSTDSSDSDHPPDDNDCTSHPPGRA